MFTQPLFVVGVALTAIGFVTFATVIFSKGGFSRMRQFGVMRAVLRGDHGSGTRVVFLVALVAMLVGSGLTFAGVGAADAARLEACGARCRDLGYPDHRIGPNSDRDDADRTTWFVACICEGADRPPTELRAEGL
ncbi:MAG: hypothetical protein KC619_19455 [Myxococcales bacterium]|nr:hypothetical protein [Myxococcales bacterium]